jgi:tetratricopeptide (TPR) repeat protein
LDNESVSYPLSGSLSATLGINPLKDANHTLSLAASIRKAEQASPTARFGLEYAFNEMLFVRTGMNNSKFAAGIGIKYSVVSFDYALVDRDLDYVHTFTLTTSFGKSVKERLEDRIAKREAEFNQLMGERLTEKNRMLVSSLTLEGQKFLEDGRLAEAVSVLERTMFMAKANGFDTSKVSELFNEANRRLNDALQIKQYREYMNSAENAMAKDDFISARYFASLAAEQQANSIDAKNLIDKATKAIGRTTAREDLIQERLVRSDSLLNYGKITEAINLLTGLSQLYASDRRITQMLNKAHFERLREKATSAQAQRKDIEALLLIDSALTIFPNHEWFLTLRSTIKAKQARGQAPEARATVSTQPKLSGQLLKDVEQAYSQARSMFTKGDLAGAIKYWENVERVAPDYQSVRDYLLKAYKFLGVEFYGKGELRQAINIWQKASQLVPSNEEIKNYIQRTETELRKLEQLSYETE